MGIPDWLTVSRTGKELKELADEVKSTKSLVDLIWNIGKAVVKAGYDKQQADKAYSDYLHKYEQRHALVKILGMNEPADLSAIYTEVRVISPSLLHGFRTQAELQETFLSGERSLAGHERKKIKAQFGLTVANHENNRFLNVLGAPGSGKSTYLRFIGLMALQSHRHSTTGRLLRGGKPVAYSYNILPVLVELKNLNTDDLDLVSLIDEELQTNGFPENFGRAALRSGGLVVLLDGLDEVAADILGDTIENIRDLVDKHPECRYVTSCRTAFCKDYFTRFNDVLLTDFTNNQIKNLIKNWFKSDGDRKQKYANKLWKILNNSWHEATLELARTPLLATFLCLVFDDSQQLPANRADLYDRALRILLERWAATKRVHGGKVFPKLSTRRELSLLEQIAGPSYEKENYFFTSRDLAARIEEFLVGDIDGPDEVDGRKVLEEIETKQGLLVQRAHDRYSFSHLTLQEYLAACHYYKAGRSSEIAKKHCPNHDGVKCIYCSRDCKSQTPTNSCDIWQYARENACLQERCWIC